MNLERLTTSRRKLAVPCSRRSRGATDVVAVVTAVYPRK